MRSLDTQEELRGGGAGGCHVCVASSSCEASTNVMALTTDKLAMEPDLYHEAKAT